MVVAKRGACVAAFSAHLSHYRLLRLCGRRSDRTRAPGTSAAVETSRHRDRRKACSLLDTACLPLEASPPPSAGRADAFELEAVYGLPSCTPDIRVRCPEFLMRVVHGDTRAQG